MYRFFILFFISFLSSNMLAQSLDDSDIAKKIEQDLIETGLDEIIWDKAEENLNQTLPQTEASDDLDETSITKILEEILMNPTASNVVDIVEEQLQPELVILVNNFTEHISTIVSNKIHESIYLTPNNQDMKPISVRDRNLGDELGGYIGGNLVNRLKLELAYRLGIDVEHCHMKLHILNFAMNSLVKKVINTKKINFRVTMGCRTSNIIFEKVIRWSTVEFKHPDYYLPLRKNQLRGISLNIKKPSEKDLKKWARKVKKLEKKRDREGTTDLFQKVKKRTQERLEAISKQEQDEAGRSVRVQKELPPKLKRTLLIVENISGLRFNEIVEELINRIESKVGDQVTPFTASRLDFNRSNFHDNISKLNGADYDILLEKIKSTLDLKVGVPYSEFCDQTLKSKRHSKSIYWSQKNQAFHQDYQLTIRCQFLRNDLNLKLNWNSKKHRDDIYQEFTFEDVSFHLKKISHKKTQKRIKKYLEFVNEGAKQ